MVGVGLMPHRWAASAVGFVPLAASLGTFALASVVVCLVWILNVETEVHAQSCGLPAF